MRRVVAAAVLLLLALPASAGYLFDGTNDSVHWGNLSALSSATTLACSAWVWQDHLTTDHWIMGAVDGSPGVFWIQDDVGSVSGRTNTYKILVTEDAASGGTAANIEGATGAAVEDAWQHVYFSFTANAAGGLQLWIGGAEDANSPVTTANIANVGLVATNWTAGESPAGTFDRQGRLAELACWTRVLTDDEIIALSKGVSPALLPVNLVFYAPLHGWAGDRKGGNAGTVTNAVVTQSHPRMFGTAAAQSVVPPGAAAAVVPGCMIGGPGQCVIGRLE